MNGHAMLVKGLLGAGADVFPNLSGGKTALHLAAAKGHEVDLNPDID